ncbi:hypothetical protein FRC07_014702, partial [Ceratobasidium sp. 392]
MARLGPAQPFDNADHLRERIRKIFGREATPDTIVPDSPGRVALPDPNSHLEYPGFLNPVRYRSVSAVPTPADAPPLHPVDSRSNSRPNSVAGNNNELDNSLDELENGAYDKLLNGLDDLDLEPDGLDLDGASNLGDDEDVEDNFYAWMDNDPEQNPDTEDPGAEDEADNPEAEDRRQPLAFNDEPGADPDDLQPADDAAMDEPDLLWNIYIYL